MDKEAFRKAGHELVDFIADYLDGGAATYPVTPPTQPGDVYRQIPDQPPQQPETWESVQRDVQSVVMPNVTHWQSPNWFAFFPGNASYAGVLGELLSAGLGQQGMLWATSPACTELETKMLDWLAVACGLPGRFLSTGTSQARDGSTVRGGGVIQGTASEAVLVCLIAARHHAVRQRVAKEGLAPGSAEEAEATTRWMNKAIAYTSDQTHSSVEKAARLAGLPPKNFRLIPSDDALRLDVVALEKQLAEDKAAGLLPFLIVASVGTTSTTAVDPVRAAAALTSRYEEEPGQIWLHVDAAMAGTAALLPEMRSFLLDGVEFADSYNFNPHKWMAINFDCSALFLADRNKLISSMSIVPAYLRNTASDSGAVIDYRDWQIPLGRRFRALKIWFAFRLDGTSGLQTMVRRHLDLTRWLEKQVLADDRFIILTPITLQLVCFALRDPKVPAEAPRKTPDRFLVEAPTDNALTTKLKDAINATGKQHVTHTVVRGKYLIRISIGSRSTGEEHVKALWETISQCASEVLAL